MYIQIFKKIWNPCATLFRLLVAFNKHVYMKFSGPVFWACCTDKKENKIFLIYREIESGAVAKSYMRKGFLIYEEMRKYFPIYEEAVSHI